MYLECRGTGSPTVVLVSGLDSAADVWTGYQPNPSLAAFARVARFTRVCAYDRPGTPVGDNLTPSRSTPIPSRPQRKMRSPTCTPCCGPLASPAPLSWPATPTAA